MTERNSHPESVLARDIVPGDVLLCAAFGGAWTSVVSRVHVGASTVVVSMGRDKVDLSPMETCLVIRGESA